MRGLLWLVSFLFSFVKLAKVIGGLPEKIYLRKNGTRTRDIIVIVVQWLCVKCSSKKPFIHPTCVLFPSFFMSLLNGVFVFFLMTFWVLSCNYLPSVLQCVFGDFLCFISPSYFVGC